MNPLQDLSRLLASRRLLVVGGLNVDQLLRVEETPGDDGSARVTEYNVAFGGHAGNCACALARLGVSVAVFGSVGTDADGAALVADLESCGVDTSRVRRVPGVPTGRVIIPSFPGHRYMLMHRGANDVWPTRAAEIEAAVAGFDAVVLFDPEVPFAEALFDLLRGRATRLYWNPGGLLARLPWIRSRLNCADVVIMNRAETRAAFGEVTCERASAGLRGERPDFRLIQTLGPAGARLHERGGVLQVQSFPAQVVDETGAGDAFTAGFIAFDNAGFDGAAALRLACAVGACATEATGARAGLPELETLARRWGLVAELSARGALPEAAAPA